MPIIINKLVDMNIDKFESEESIVQFVCWNQVSTSNSFIDHVWKLLRNERVFRSVEFETQSLFHKFDAV